MADDFRTSPRDEPELRRSLDAIRRRLPQRRPFQLQSNQTGATIDEVREDLGNLVQELIQARILEENE